MPSGFEAAPDCLVPTHAHMHMHHVHTFFTATTYVHEGGGEHIYRYIPPPLLHMGPANWQSATMPPYYIGSSARALCAALATLVQLLLYIGTGTPCPCATCTCTCTCDMCMCMLLHLVPLLCVRPTDQGGCEVEVYWLDDDGCGGLWEKAIVAPTIGGDEVRCGWATPNHHP